MSLKDKASYIFKPSRYKSGTAYAFRGSDLTALRSSTGTRVNASGNIESVASGTPRLNYDPTDLTKEPWVLYEKAATNILANSNSYSTYDKPTSGNISYEENATISPDGTSNAVKIKVNFNSTYTYFRDVTATVSNTFSVFVKKGNWRFIGIRNADASGIHSVFDFDLGEFTSVISGHTCSVTKYKDGWYRLSDYVESASATNGLKSLCFCESATSGSEGSTIQVGAYYYAYGWQSETGVKVPTSYIPTSGSSATRAADTLYANSISSSIGSGQGVVYCDFYGQPGDTGSYENMFSINVGSISASVNIFKHANGTFYYEVYNGGSAVVFSTYNSSATTSYRTKMAVYYANNDFGLYINGVKVHSDTGGTAPTGMSSINFNAPAGGYPGTKDIYEFLLFKERLSDAELASLTSFDDYEELVDIKGLTWESSTITNNRLSELAAL